MAKHNAAEEVVSKFKSSEAAACSKILSSKLTTANVRSIMLGHAR